MGLGAFYDRPATDGTTCRRCGGYLYPVRCGHCGEAKLYFCAHWDCDSLPAGECKCPSCDVCGADADEHEEGRLCCGDQPVV
jgi:hypothetical protein